MKGLLLKDIYMMAKNCRMYLLITVVFLAMSALGRGTTFYVVYPALLAGVLPVTLLSYDERDRWSQYCDALPASRSQVVGSKYIISLALLAAVVALSAVAQSFRFALDADFKARELYLLISMLLAFGLVEAALLLPFVFRFGVEKGRLAYYVVLGGACAVASILSINDTAAGWLTTAGLLSAILPPAALAFFFLSYLLAVRLYEKREL